MTVYISTYVKVWNGDVLVQDVLCASRRIEIVLRCMEYNLNRFLENGWILLAKEPGFFSMQNPNTKELFEVQLVEYEL